MVRKILVAVLLVPFIVACAPFAAPPQTALTPEQTSLVQVTCDRVMGLPEAASIARSAGKAWPNRWPARRKPKGWQVLWRVPPAGPE